MFQKIGDVEVRGTITVTITCSLCGKTYPSTDEHKCEAQKNSEKNPQDQKKDNSRV